MWDDTIKYFIEGPPLCNGKNTIPIVVGHLSKSSQFMLLSHPYTAKMVVEKFMEVIIKLDRMSSSIISDRDLIFISNISKEFLKISRTQLKLRSSYHP